MGIPAARHSGRPSSNRRAWKPRARNNATASKESAQYSPRQYATISRSGLISASLSAGAEYVLFADANVNFPFRKVPDGDVLELGNVTIKVLHTPGHTPEHISLVVTDHTRSEEPWFVLTGHTLMVGDLGRTELATSAEEGARNLFATVQKLKALPDHLEVLPGAYSGSVCGRSLSGKPTSTIGFEKRYNKAFRVEDEPTFVRTMLADIPPAPPQAARVRALNSGLVTPA
jgi:hydroxyacylglutathione hydrolase